MLVWRVSVYNLRGEIIEIYELHDIKLENFMRRKDIVALINRPDVGRFELQFQGYHHEI